MGTAREEPNYRSNALKAAEDLGYSEEYLKKIRKAKTDAEISRLMAEARKERFK